MKLKIALKTLYRSPVRTILTFILLAAVTFALFSQVMEYANTKEEFDVQKVVKAVNKSAHRALIEFTKEEKVLINKTKEKDCTYENLGGVYYSLQDISNMQAIDFDGSFFDVVYLRARAFLKKSLSNLRSILLNLRSNLFYNQ